MSFTVKPDFFDLNELECRLLAPRLAFQKVMQAPRGNQLKIKGNIVNVPADVNNTVNVLPRLPQESGTVKVQLKRRLQYKSSALSLNVRPYEKKNNLANIQPCRPHTCSITHMSFPLKFISSDYLILSHLIFICLSKVKLLATYVS